MTGAPKFGSSRFGMLLIASMLTLASPAPATSASTDGPRGPLAAHASGTVYFADDFESGLSQWNLQATWGLTQAEARGGSSSLTDSPGAPYLPNANSAATMAHAIDLSGAVDPVLTWWHKGFIHPDGDFGRVQISTNGGTSWSDLRVYGDGGYQWHYMWARATWSPEQVDLRNYRTSNVLVRFVLTANGTTSVADGWYLDDLSIREKDAQRLAYPFADDFESGLSKWVVSGHDWDITESTGRSATRSLTDSPAGNYVETTYCSATLVHPLDLSTAVEPVLTWWHKGFIHPDGPDDHGLVQISTDGGTTWLTLKDYGDGGYQWHTMFSRVTWSYEQVDLRSYRGTSVLVRFHMMAANWNRSVGDGWYIDDVRIAEKDPQRLTYPFTDDFENGMSNWTVSGHDWDLTSATARSGSRSLTDSPAGNYAISTYCAATLVHPLDLSAAVDPVLTWWHRGFIHPDGPDDHGLVQVSTDGGTTWATLRDYGDGGYQWHTMFYRKTWSREQADLSSYKGSSVLLRFQFMAANWNTNVSDGWYIDDVRVEERDTLRLAYPFTDDFENGMANWIVSGHDWDLTDSAARSGSHSLTDSPGGNYTTETYCSATMAHPLDLSTAVDPVLTWWHRGFIHPDGPDDHGLVQVSTDGGTTWATLRDYGDGGYQWHTMFYRKTWSREQADLSSYKGSSVLLRLQFTAANWNTNVSDGWYIDDVRVEERDTQRLAYPFTDDFENGMANWIVSGHDWDLTDSAARSGSHSLTDSPGGNYTTETYCSATMAHPLDLSTAVDPVLTWWHKGFIHPEGPDDHGLVQVSTDGGCTWTSLRDYGDGGYQWQSMWNRSTWCSEQVDLRNYLGSSVLLRFQFTAANWNQSVGDGWYIDDVKVEEKDAQRLAFPFTDDFENGLTNWTVSGHDWALTESTGRTLTHSLTDSPVGNYAANSYCAATLAHPINLSATTHPILWFWHKGVIGSGDYGRAQVSADGGTTWNDLASWTNWQQAGYSPPAPYAPGAGSGVQLDLSSYRTSNVKVRFILTADGSASDGWNIDDVRIREVSDLSDVPGSEIPAAYGLSPAYPNPFNPQTNIAFALPEGQHAKLEVFDTAGRRVRVLADEDRPAGRYEVRWDGNADDGSRVASGVYFCRMVAGPFSDTKRMTLIK